MFFSVCINIFYWNKSWEKNEHTNFSSNSTINNNSSNNGKVISFIRTLFHSSYLSAIDVQCMYWMIIALLFYSMFAVLYLDLFWFFNTNWWMWAKQKHCIMPKSAITQQLNTCRVLHVHGYRCMCLFMWVCFTLRKRANILCTKRLYFF